MDRVEWLRLYAEFREVEEELHQALPPAIEQLGQLASAAELLDLDVDRTAGLIEVLRQRWFRFQEFAER